MKIPAVIFFYTLLLALPLFARDKVDVLVMNNGDRLTCEIKGLDAGVLYIGLDYVKGTTSVDWSKVQHLESKQLFMVKTEAGSVYTGTLSTETTGAARPVHIEVAASPENSEVLERQQIVTIDQISNSFWQQLNGQFNSGLIYSKGNQSTQYSLGSQVAYPRERWSAGATFNSTLSASAGVATATRNDASIYGRRMLRWNNWFYTGIGNFLQSSAQSISLQTNLAGGIGHYLKNTNRAKIAVIGGFAFQNTRYSQTLSDQASQNTAAAMAAVEVDLFKFDKTSLTATATAFPSMTQPGRVFTSTNVTYYVKLPKDFNWNFSFYGNWDNQPPPHFSGSDYGTSSGLGWSFGNSGR